MTHARHMLAHTARSEISSAQLPAAPVQSSQARRPTTGLGLSVRENGRSGEMVNRRICHSTNHCPPIAACSHFVLPEGTQGPALICLGPMNDARPRRQGLKDGSSASAPGTARRASGNRRVTARASLERSWNSCAARAGQRTSASPSAEQSGPACLPGLAVLHAARCTLHIVDPCTVEDESFPRRSLSSSAGQPCLACHTRHACAFRPRVRFTSDSCAAAGGERPHAPAVPKVRSRWLNSAWRARLAAVVRREAGLELAAVQRAAPREHPQVTVKLHGICLGIASTIFYRTCYFASAHSRLRKSEGPGRERLPRHIGSRSPRRCVFVARLSSPRGLGFPGHRAERSEVQQL